jgi:hypothetical protein
MGTNCCYQLHTEEYQLSVKLFEANTGKYYVLKSLIKITYVFHGRRDPNADHVALSIRKSWH